MKYTLKSGACGHAVSESYGNGTPPQVRYPFPFLVHLTPVGEDGATPGGDSVVVVGKHISERGLGFYHPQPLPHRRMIVSLEGPRGDWFGFSST